MDNRRRGTVHSWVSEQPLFITNILCRHQVGIWDSLSKKDITFTYLYTRNSNEPISIRYIYDKQRNYTMNSDSLTEGKLLNLINKQDIIFYGSIEDKRVKKIIENLQNAFIITENYSKQDYHEIYRLRGLKRKLEFIRTIKYTLKDINKRYVFCASGHTGEEFVKARASPNALLKFCYFPHYKNLD